jgi:uroporphyrinogen-III synthase
LNPHSARHSSAPLAGTTVILTRPVGGAASLHKEVQIRGGDAVNLPGLSLRLPSDPQGAARSLFAEAEAEVGAGWIFASPAAVRFAFRLVPALRVSGHASAFGVGIGTQRALARHGIRAIVPDDRSDSEGLLVLPELADVRGQRFALIGAPGGRDLIAPTLRERGAQVESIHVYERRPPRLTRHHFDALAGAADPLITLISSGEALANLVALLPPPLLARLRHQLLVVSSVRLEALAHEHGFEDVLVAVSAAPDDLLDAAGRALARHRL